MTDTRRVAVVTGASRGAGRGIAHALGSHGCIVYVTGRTESTDESSAAGTIGETAELVTAAGGEGVAVRVDHSDDEQVKALFEQVGHEQGRVDILVNNAAIIRDEMMGRTRFWEEPLSVMDTLDVGLRSSYAATVYAAPLMLPQRERPGGLHVVLGRRPLRLRPGLRRSEGRHRQDGRRYGVGLQRVQYRRSVDLDGFTLDRSCQKNHRQ